MLFLTQQVTFQICVSQWQSNPRIQLTWMPWVTHCANASQRAQVLRWLFQQSILNALKSGKGIN